MVASRDILDAVDGVIRVASPERVILFGSYAYGNPTADSDIDLLILMPHAGTGHAAASRIRLALDIKFPLDLLVRDPKSVAQRLNQNDFFLAEVMKKGIVLHDAADARVGKQGRNRLRRRLAPAKVA